MKEQAMYKVVKGIHGEAVTFSEVCEVLLLLSLGMNHKNKVLQYTIEKLIKDSKQ